MNNIGADSNTLVLTQFFSRAKSQAFGNIKQVTEIEELILLFQNQILNLPKLILLYKTFKAAWFIIANRIFLNRTNTELLAADIQKK